MLQEKKFWWLILLGVFLLLGLFAASFYNYLLFHTLIEMFAIVVACSIFIISWNSRNFMNNNCLVFLGIAYLFVGGIDLIHTLAYTGMGIFVGYDTNLPTQLWISARYYESLSLFIAPFFLRRRMKIGLVFFCFCAATLLLFLSIFYGRYFPSCFVEGQGLTSFKKVSEYVISGILLASIFSILRQRDQFDRGVLKLLIISITVTIASELSFTFYKDPYALANQMGHFLKLLSFYLIYKAIIQTGIKEPYAILLRDLRKSGDLLEEEKDKAQNYFDVAGSILVIIDAGGRVSLINKKGCEVLGYPKDEIIGKNWLENFLPERIQETVRATFQKLMSEGVEQVRHFENPVLTKDGEERIITWHNTILNDRAGNAVATLSSGEDITELKQAEEALKRIKKELTIRNKIAEIFLTLPDEQMFGEVLQVLLEAMESEFGIFGYIDEHGVLIIPSMTRDIWEKCQVPDKTIVFTREKWGGIWGRALVEKRSLFANEGLHVPEGHIPITRVLVVPVIYAGQAIGILEVANKSTDYSHKDQEFLETIARKIAPLLNARLQRDREERERKQNEELLRQARSELEQRVKERTFELLEAQRIAHLGNWSWNIVENTLWWSDEVYRIFGLEPQQFDATYQAFLSYVHPDDRKLVEQAVDEALYQGKSYVIDHRVIRPNGTERIVHEQAEVTYDNNGRAVRMVGTVQDITAQKRMEEEIHRNQKDLRELTAELQLTEERERRRLASDLHDSIGQILSFSSRELSSLQRSSSRKITKSLQEIAGQLDEALRQTRTLSFDLSPSILYDLGLEVAVEDLVDTMSRERKIRCFFESCQSPKPLTEDVKVLLYRSVRELLINAAKHANASFVKVSLLRSSSDIYIKVEDDGQGFDASVLNDSSKKTKGFGIFSIRERLGYIGGHLKIESAKGKGTKAILIAPLDLEKEDE